MKVELVALTQPYKKGNREIVNPMYVVEQSASVCYDSEPTANFKIAKGCAKTGHMSVYEHISFTFHVTGVSRALLAQLTRHRHASYSVRSQRYCDESEFEFVVPKSLNSKFSEDVISVCAFQAAMKNAMDAYDDILSGEDVSKEDARMVLPNACCTELYLTMNARALIESSHLRLCNRAQEEIRDMFGYMKKEVMDVCPEVADLMVPSCEINPQYPFCPEAKSCGRHPKLSEVYHAE